MKRSNLINSIFCKYQSILTGLIFITTSVVPLATSAIAQTAPALTVTNTTLTGSIAVGSAAIYNITVTNTSASTVYDVKITDLLPAGFKYGGELNIATAGGAAASKGSIKPALNAQTLVWDRYTIPAAGSVSIFFTADTSSATDGSYSNASVDVAYANTAGGMTLKATYDGTTSTADDVTLKPVPPTPSVVTAFPSTSTASTCAQPGGDGIGNLSGIVNTYFQPALKSVPAQATSIDIMAGAAKGAANDIKPGDLVLIVQMQDATITQSDDAAYGSGNSTNQGSGQSNMGKTGLYEYAIASSTVSATNGGSSLTLKKPLVNSYVSSAAIKLVPGIAAKPAVPPVPAVAAVYNKKGQLVTAAKAAIPGIPEIPAIPAIPGSGQKRFQVIRVPQYASASLTGQLSAYRWDGNVGGILAVDTFGKFDFNGQAISVNNSGFRGGYGPPNPYTNANSGYTSPTTTTFGSGKGEGTAGTPRYIWNGAFVDTNVEGYPGGDTGRGAPANAGGGGDFHNAGGGGGGNAGRGGQGGLPWSGSPTGGKDAAGRPTGGSTDAGGRPGAPSSTKNLVPWTAIMGGGGGGGEANDATTGVRGGSGGGIVMLRAGKIVGTGTIFANGENGDRGVYGANPDGAGGGGAGGTVLIQSRNATSANLTIQAKGGAGGNSVFDNLHNHTPHGPGGGGSGGVVFYNAPGVTVNPSVTGGVSGHTADDNLYPSSVTPHGATAGSSGVASAYTGGEDPFADVNSGTCTPAIAVKSTTSTPVVAKDDTAKYKITITNNAPNGNAAYVEIKDTLPPGFVYTKTDSVVLTNGATQPTVSNPTVGATIPVWGTFTIPPGGGVEVSFQALVKEAAVVGQTQENKATAYYPDPARESATTPAKEPSPAAIDNTGGAVKVKPKTPEGLVWNFSPNIRIVHK